ncbi:LVIVD repeat-containing protein [Nocardioides coralli]|uniref:LVIVD repeat-containing protein n=1 Tax=Nocardioides coralli TaxID=2872154 RepID=UPI001CA40F25|nr:hypothetical protein [Nocardioides coralli]QZY30349.1 hypothetical protein K6T13_06740 [Nocardioides coralli]
MPTNALARLAAASVLASLVLVAPPASGHGDGDVATNTRGIEVETQGQGKRMEFVANLQYDETGGVQNGSDIEFVRLGRKEYALAGTLRKGMQIIDITKPRNPRKVAVYDCAISQGDIQVWRTGGRVLASYTADGTVRAEGAQSQCGRDLQLEPSDAGTVLVDITSPSNPQSLSFLPVPQGSHNMTLHPSGDYLYNSNSDLYTSGKVPNVTIYDVRNPLDPKKVVDYELPFTPGSLGTESHDITFDSSGDRAYVAALSQTLVLDTSDPRRPELISKIVDPTINVVHQSDPFRVQRPNGTWRELLIITDERAGAAASAECPGGGLHVYDITGKKEQSPEKLGAWFIPAAQVQAGATCTSHVLRIYERQKMMTIAWYAQGVRVLDIAGLATYQGSATDIALGDGIGMKEVGNYVFADSDAWSFKTNKIRRDGSFFGYANDLVRGFDVFRFKGLQDRKVAPLKPKDVAPRKQSQQARALAPLAVLLPAIVVVGLIRRRLRQDG